MGKRGRRKLVELSTFKAVELDLKGGSIKRGGHLNKEMSLTTKTLQQQSGDKDMEQQTFVYITKKEEWFTLAAQNISYYHHKQSPSDMRITAESQGHGTTNKKGPPPQKQT